MSAIPSSPPRASAPSTIANLQAPPHPSSHRHSHNSPQRRRPDNPRRKSVPSHRHQRSLSVTAATSPEVINSLVDSLSKLSPSPLHNPALYGSLAPPESDDPYSGRHGALTDGEYEGAYLHPDDAALAPVVRTSKPPSGFSPHTSMDFDAGKRTSYHSGLSVRKGSVDIPNYVRNYMNRAPGERDLNNSTSIADRRISRDSSLSTKGGARLSYVSSREFMRDSERDAELRASAAEILAATGGKDIDKAVPKRSSSYGKSQQRSATFPMAIVTHSSPMVKSPLVSPGLPPPDLPEDYEGEESAPAPELPRNRDRHRNSKLYHPGTVKKRISSEKIHSPTRSPSKRQSDPHGTTSSNLFSHFQSNAPARPSFHSENFQLQNERPSSADSIDDDVEKYLCSPRLSQKLRIPGTNRIISFSEVGDPSGFAVFVCVGMGLTRYVTAFYDELAATLGLRLITPDRPGVGESTAIEESERTVLNWPDDVLFICQSLKITKFSILAHSAGAIYALATALRMPGHIRGKIHLLAPWIPPSQMENIVTKGENGEKQQKLGGIPTSQRILRALPTPVLKVANSSFMSATSSSLTTSLPKTSTKRKKRSTTPAPKRNAEKEKQRDDKIQQTLANVKLQDESEASLSSPSFPAAAATTTTSTTATTATTTSPPSPEPLNPARQALYDSRLTNSIWALSTRHANPATDLLVCLERNRPVGFRYVDITREVVIHHGAKDTRVPVENVRWLGRTMRKCVVRVLDDEGHALMASARVMGGVLEEIATEWREWRWVVEKRGRGRGEERVWAA